MESEATQPSSTVDRVRPIDSMAPARRMTATPAEAVVNVRIDIAEAVAVVGTVVMSKTVMEESARYSTVLQCATVCDGIK